jgi:hypothetical protein
VHCTRATNPVLISKSWQAKTQKNLANLPKIIITKKI